MFSSTKFEVYFWWYHFTTVSSLLRISNFKILTEIVARRSVNLKSYTNIFAQTFHSTRLNSNTRLCDFQSILLLYTSFAFFPFALHRVAVNTVQKSSRAILWCEPRRIIMQMSTRHSCPLCPSVTTTERFKSQSRSRNALWCISPASHGEKYRRCVTRQPYDNAGYSVSNVEKNLRAAVARSTSSSIFFLDVSSVFVGYITLFARRKEFFVNRARFFLLWPYRWFHGWYTMTNCK